MYICVSVLTMFQRRAYDCRACLRNPGVRAHHRVCADTRVNCTAHLPPSPDAHLTPPPRRPSGAGRPPAPAADAVGGAAVHRVHGDAQLPGGPGAGHAGTLRALCCVYCLLFVAWSCGLWGYIAQLHRAFLMRSYAFRAVQDPEAEPVVNPDEEAAPPATASAAAPAGKPAPAAKGGKADPKAAAGAAAPVSGVSPPVGCLAFRLSIVSAFSGPGRWHCGCAGCACKAACSL